MESAKRIISGTWGEVWFEGQPVSECYGLQAKVSMNKEDIQQCGKMAVDKKVKSITMTGSLKLYKVSSRMGIAIADKIKAGEDPRFTILSNLDDPDAYGAEKVTLYNVSFDDITLADWEVGNVGKTESPFTFTDFEYIDKIEVR